MRPIHHKQTKQQNNNHWIGRLLRKLPTLTSSREWYNYGHGNKYTKELKT